MDLYVFPPAPNCLKVIALAAHLKLPIQLKQVSVPHGEQKAREFLELNPNGRLPLLVEGPLRLWESDAILFFLADKAGSSVLPRHAVARADMLRWMFWQTAHFEPLCGVMIMERGAKRILPDLGVPNLQEICRAEAALEPLLLILQHHFEKLDYLCGELPTLADFSVAANLVYWRDAGIVLERYPEVLGWYERFAALPAWQESLKHKASLPTEPPRSNGKEAMAEQATYV